jgi:hypothetical protein
VKPFSRRQHRREAPVATRADAASVFLTLSADGAAEAEDQRSTPRKALMVFVAFLVALAMPLFWVAGADSSDDGPKAVANKQVAAADDDDDDDDSGTGTGTGTKSSDGSARTTGGNTNSKSGTGRDTRGHTDRGDRDTGKSTRGETDGRDGTGKTERR